MNRTKHFLDALRVKAGSDGKAAALMGVSQVTYSRWRAGRDFPSDENGIKLAELLGQDARFVAAVIRADRAKSEEARSMWRSVADAFGKAAAVAVLAATPFLLPSPAQAGTSHNQNSLVNGSEYTLPTI